VARRQFSDCLFALPVLASDGKLLRKAGLSQLEGSGGGGLFSLGTLGDMTAQTILAASAFYSDVRTGLSI